MQKYHTVNRMQTDQLVYSICRRAEGVFLWVYLVTQDLLQGLQACDSLAMLHDRITRYDNSLHGLFSEFLDRIDRVHIKSATKFLKLVEFNGGASLLGLALGFETDLKTKITHWQRLTEREHMDAVDLMNDLQDFSTLLIAQTAGLLEMDDSDYRKGVEIQHMLQSAEYYRLFNFRYLPTAPYCEWLEYGLLTKFTFIYRSAVDFMNNHEKGHVFISHSNMPRTTLQHTDMKRLCGEASLFFTQLHRLYDLPSLDERACWQTSTRLQRKLLEIVRSSCLEWDTSLFPISEGTREWFKQEVEELQACRKGQIASYNQCEVFLTSMLFFDPDISFVCYCLLEGTGNWLPTQIDYTDKSKSVQYLTAASAAQSEKNRAREGIEVRQNMITKLLESGADPNYPTPEFYSREDPAIYISSSRTSSAFGIFLRRLQLRV